jgi:hypothetical protein
MKCIKTNIKGNDKEPIIIRRVLFWYLSDRFPIRGGNINEVSGKRVTIT